MRLFVGWVILMAYVYAIHEHLYRTAQVAQQNRRL